MRKAQGRKKGHPASCWLPSQGVNVALDAECTDHFRENTSHRNICALYSSDSELVMHNGYIGRLPVTDPLFNWQQQAFVHLQSRDDMKPS